jgi:DNA-directed RNA polymerase specialized sigma24 family protein
MTDTQIGGNRTDFPSTKWGLVRLAARDTASMDSIIRVYWKPLYFFVRQKGFDNEAAKDLVQGFLTLLVSRKAFASADPARGRFRSLLLASLENFIKDRRKESLRAKRGGGEKPLPLDFAGGEEEYARSSDKRGSPEYLIGRTWAKCLFAECLSQIEANPLHALALKLHLAGEDYASIARRTGLSETAARTAVHRLFGQFRDILTRHLLSIAIKESDLPEEIDEFISLLR